MRFLRCESSKLPARNGRKISIIGAGPAGLGAAGYLLCKGYDVRIYDAHPEPGGLLLFGIPDYRLSKQGVRDGVRELIATNRLELILNKKVGVDVDLTDAMDGADALLISTGTLETKTIGIPCEDSPQVFPSVEWLIDYHRIKLGYRPMFGYTNFLLKEPVGIIGGGLTAADAAHVSNFELKYKTKIIYRRTKDVAPMGKAEITRLEKGGVEFLENLSPKMFLCDEGKNLLGGIFYRTSMIGGKSREAKLVYGEEVRIDFLSAINAIGAKPTPPPGIESLGIALTKDGTIAIDSINMTSKKGIFAAGDVAVGPSKIGIALKSGIDAASNIDKFLSH